MKNQNTGLMAGKTCLVTGSSRGIGFYTALGLAEKGAHVILISHNKEHLEDAVNQINSLVIDGAARYYLADLASQAEIREVARRINNDIDHLDVLVNNVGGWFTKYKESPDGIEMTFALNHLSYFLLTGLLLPLLKKRTPERVINVSSDAHKQPKNLNLDIFQNKTKFKPFAAYAQSKLANVLFTYELSGRLDSSGISVNALHPGLVSSELYRNYGFISSVIKLIAKIFGKNSQEGAETSVYLASSPEVTGLTGRYFADKTEKKSSPASYDSQAAKKLWEISEGLTGFEYTR